MTKSSRDNPEYTLIVAPEAESDVVDILHYTLAEWGRLQAEKYQGILDGGFSRLQRTPGVGHSRRDIPTGYKAYHAGQHVILYRVEAETVFVVRVLHGSMDFTGKL